MYTQKNNYNTQKNNYNYIVFVFIFFFSVELGEFLSSGFLVVCGGGDEYKGWWERHSPLNPSHMIFRSLNCNH